MNAYNKTVRTLLLVCVLITSCEEETGVRVPTAPEEIDLTESFYYEINLDDRSDDTFKVLLFTDNLTNDNATFQFPATTPGTYDIHDIGRFVTLFKAYDKNYNELEVTHPSVNQWILSDPENTHIIQFEVKETFDTPVNENDIYKMAGTSIESSHALLNAFDVLGYPTGLKERDFYVSIDYPSSWSVGTSLPKDENGYYYATDYDKLVDSPLLLGYITTATTTVEATDINVFVYSKNNLILASQIRNDINQVLDDAHEFLDGLPVDRYSFIYLFDDYHAGALEHSYSSVYVLGDQPYTEPYARFLRDIAAHEFFHIVTPLNIHSEIIEDFNFAVPTASRHLWLYEGVTEWAAHIMQYRNGNLPLSVLLNRFAGKASTNDNLYDPAVSLTQMSLTCYGDGSSEFGNVYNKGALVAALLDIRLLELSGGTRGLREVILELIETYGPENAFSEENFFADLTEMTYPEIEDFIDRYIEGTEALPINQYFSNMGISYTDYQFTLDSDATTEELEFRANWSINF